MLIELRAKAGAKSSLMAVLAGGIEDNAISQKLLLTVRRTLQFEARTVDDSLVLKTSNMQDVSKMRSTELCLSQDGTLVVTTSPPLSSDEIERLDQAGSQEKIGTAATISGVFSDTVKKVKDQGLKELDEPTIKGPEKKQEGPGA